MTSTRSYSSRSAALDGLAPQADRDLFTALEPRVGALHLRQRLGLESDHQARIFGRGRNFFHLENWYSVHGLIRHGLRLAGLHGRGRRNALRIKVQENPLTVPGLPAAFEGYTILQVSDPHLDMSPGLPNAVAELVRGLQYDICVLTGDFRARTFGPYRPAVEALARVRAYLRDPVYAVLGNHDTIRMVPDLESQGIRVLLNESVALRRGGASLYLAGVDDPHYYKADNLEKAAQHVPDEGPSLLLAHSPEIYRHVAHAGFDAMLCGHTHGGQICLPGGLPLMCNARCPRAMCAGPWSYHDMIGYTSRGAGVSVVDVRLNCPGEVTLHRLRGRD